MLNAPFTTKLIAVGLSITALALGRAFFIPIALALCFQALLTPLVRGLGRLRIPAPAGAAVVVLGALAVLVIGGWALSGPARDWVDKAPANIATARRKLREIGRPLDRLTAAAVNPQAEPAAAAPLPPAAPAAPTAPPPAPPQAAPSSATQSLFAQLLGRATTVVAGGLEVIVLLYLMLAAGNMLFRKLVKLFPGPDELRTASRSSLVISPSQRSSTWGRASPSASPCGRSGRPIQSFGASSRSCSSSFRIWGARSLSCCS
jgi:predicted PurR-regulated permease PerM